MNIKIKLVNYFIITHYNFPSFDLANTKWSNILDSGKAGESVLRWYQSCINKDTFKVLEAKSSANVKTKNEKANNSKVSVASSWVFPEKIRGLLRYRHQN